METESTGEESCVKLQFMEGRARPLTVSEVRGVREVLALRHCSERSGRLDSLCLERYATLR